VIVNVPLDMLPDTISNSALNSLALFGGLNHDEGSKGNSRCCNFQSDELNIKLTQFKNKVSTSRVSVIERQHKGRIAFILH